MFGRTTPDQKAAKQEHKAAKKALRRNGIAEAADGIGFLTPRHAELSDRERQAAKRAGRR